jgi:branched-chain amino acid transport system permease protein
MSTPSPQGLGGAWSNIQSGIQNLSKRWPKWLRPEGVILGILVLYPLLVFPEAILRAITGRSIGSDLIVLFIYGILALGLNVVVGYSGLLQLGIAAFFGIGAYITGMATIQGYPFQVGFLPALVLSTAGAGLLGLILAAPTMRLRGDYLALVTLGFGEVVRFTLKNLESITNGTKGLNPVPPPTPAWYPFGPEGFSLDWNASYQLFYFLCLGLLVLVVVLLRNLENSRLGRAWVAIREDELAAQCMGINTTGVKLAAFTLGAALAGLAGCLWATKLTSTADPDAYDFSRSIMMISCIILGGLGSIRGALLGVFLLAGFDNILAPMLDGFIQKSGINPTNSRFLTFSSWRLMIFGLALVLTMRFRPEGLLPSSRVKEEMHESDQEKKRKKKEAHGGNP